MVGISSMLRLITLAIVAVGMSHAAAVATEVGSGIAVAEKAYMPDASAGSEAGSAPALAEKVEVPNVAQGGGVIGYGCGYSNWPHSCWKYCIDGKRCWSKPQLTCYEDINCAGDPPCSSVCF